MTTKTLKAISEPSVRALTISALSSDDTIANAVRNRVARCFGVTERKSPTYKMFLSQAKALVELTESGVIDSATSATLLHELTANMVKLNLNIATRDLFASTPHYRYWKIKHEETGKWVSIRNRMRHA